MTRQKSPLTYRGSGTYWKSHLQKHNNPKVLTTSLWEFNNQEEATFFTLMMSEYWNIVESDEWANLKPEDALDGDRNGYHITEASIAKLKATKRKQADAGLLWSQSEGGRKQIGESLKLFNETLCPIVKAERIAKQHASQLIFYENVDPIIHQAKLDKISATHKAKNLSPWENTRINKNYDILKVWQQAENLFDMFNQGLAWTTKIPKLTNIPYARLTTMVNHFKNGWNPYEDPKFQTFKSTDIEFLK